MWPVFFMSSQQQTNLLRDEVRHKYIQICWQYDYLCLDTWHPSSYIVSFCVCHKIKTFLFENGRNLKTHDANEWQTDQIKKFIHIKLRYLSTLPLLAQISHILEDSPASCTNLVDPKFFALKVEDILILDPVFDEVWSSRQRAALAMDLDVMSYALVFTFKSFAF